MTRHGPVHGVRPDRELPMPPQPGQDLAAPWGELKPDSRRDARSGKVEFTRRGQDERATALRSSSS